jgi:cysteine desulfurase
MSRIYLDANASSVPLSEVVHKVGKLLSLYGNASSFHEHGRAMRAHLDTARAQVAQALKAKAKELIFTSGASEANRLFIDALVLFAKQQARKIRVVMSPFEHPSLLKPALLAHEEGYFDIVILASDSSGNISYEQEVLKSCEVLICCQAHNETGIILPLDQLISQVSDQTIIMSDVSQGLARLDPVAQRVDVMTFSAQKIGAFSGAGGIVLRNEARKLSAPWAGGGQEGGFRPGTEASLLLIAMGEAASSCERERKAHDELINLRDYLEKNMSLETNKIIGLNQNRLANTSAISFTSFKDPDALRISCDMAGLSVGFGSACSGLAPTGSFALNHMGFSLHEQKTCVRFSLGPKTTEEEVKEAVRRMKNIGVI